MMATTPRKTPRGTALRVAAVAEPGTIIDNKYRVDHVLGAGGMAVVVAATHVQLGHQVAIKLLQPQALGSPDTVRRVLREARALASLKSEHVTRVLDVGSLDSGDPFIVMEVHEGIDLAQHLKQVGKLSVVDAATYLGQACDAISEAHALGIVHRDIKPSNLFLTHRRDGSAVVKLMDFGISKPADPISDESLTTADASLGTPQYMSPEQFLSAKEVDTRTDIWSLGVVLHVLLTGEHPFQGPTVPALHLAIASTQPPKLRTLLTDAPEPIERLILRCLEKQVEQRLQTVEEFASILLPFADDETQRRLRRFERALDESGGPTPAFARSTMQTPPNRRTLVAAAALGLLGLASFVVYLNVVSAGRRSETISAGSTENRLPAPSASESPSSPAASSQTVAPPTTSASQASLPPPVKKPPTKSRAPSAAEGRDPYEERR